VSDPRIRTAAARLVRVLLSVPHVPWYAFELATAAELPAGTVYPLLAQLERARWVTGSWEPADPLARHRPPRRYYRLTTEGYECIHEAFAAVGLDPAGPPQIQAIPPARPGIALPGRAMTTALIGIAGLRLRGGTRRHLMAEWRAEAHHVLRNGPGSRFERLVAGAQFLAGVASAAPRSDAGTAARRVPDPDPLTLRDARRRLRAARRAWSVAAQGHAFADPERDPVGETLALHAALFCQLEVDDAQLAYGAACAIAALERGVNAG
jgi:PadR family transcriptional regulator PadR